MINAAQIRMARAALRWTAKELAEKAGVGVTTINRIEGDGSANAATLAEIQRALQFGGARFIDGGVVMVPNIRERLRAVSPETLNKFVYEFWCCRHWGALKEIVSSSDILHQLDPDSQFASAIAQLSLELGYADPRNARQLASILDALSEIPFKLGDGVTYTIVSDGDHGDNLLMARWKVVRG